MRGKSFPVAGAFNDYLVAGVGEAVQSAVAQDGVVEEAQPFLHRPVAGDDEAGDPVGLMISSYRSADCWGESRCRPRSSRISRSGIRKDRKVRSTELSTLAWAMALKKSSEWTKRTVYPARMACSPGTGPGSSCRPPRVPPAVRARAWPGTPGRRRRPAGGGPG